MIPVSFPYRDMGTIRESHPQHNAKKQVLVCFDSKPILLWFAKRCRGNRKFIFCPKLSKLKLGLELKQKFAPKQQFLNNSNPSLQMRTNIFFHDCGIWGVVVMRLPVRRILVLTHDFEMRRPVIIWLSVFAICGLWFQREQWQNCKSKQAVCFDSKPILLWLQLYAEVTGNLSFVRNCQSWSSV